MHAGADAADLLGVRAPHFVPQAVVDQASRLAGCAVAVYLIDIDGSCGRRLAGDEDQFPESILVPLGVGPEIALDALPELRRRVADLLGDGGLWPLVVRDRALGFLVTRQRTTRDLEGFVGQAALALELASGYTDVLHAARRRKEIQPAAEIQEELLPPRLARIDGAELAGGVLPSYDVGGDFFDYAGNAEGLWLTIADAAGKGNSAAALSALAVGALRAARRGGAGLEETVRIVHETLMGSETDRFLTGVFGCWDVRTRQLRWINCGHPAPLVLRADGSVDTLSEQRTYPLGILAEHRSFPVVSAPVGPGERLVLYSDGVTERRTRNHGFFGVSGITEVLSGLQHLSAAAVARAVQDAVIAASPAPLRDDATLLILAPHD